MLTQVNVNKPNEQLAELRPYNKSELCALYDVRERVLNAWLDDVPDLGVYKGRLYSPRQVFLIFDHLGWPKIK